MQFQSTDLKFAVQHVEDLCSDHADCSRYCNPLEEISSNSIAIAHQKSIQV